jgi:hypothetical protein
MGGRSPFSCQAPAGASTLPHPDAVDAPGVHTHGFAASQPGTRDFQPFAGSSPPLRDGRATATVRLDGIDDFGPPAVGNAWPKAGRV